MKGKNFNEYLILVGIRSVEFTYTDEELFNKIDYFQACYENDLSAYKALLFLKVSL